MKVKLFVPVVIISWLPSWMPVKLRIKLTIFSEVQFFYGEEDLYYNKQSAFCCFKKIFQYLPWVPELDKWHTVYPINSHILNQTLAVLDKISCYGKNSTYHCILLWLKKNNYYTELSKISWYINDKQINYFPKPKAGTKKWPAWQWKIRCFEVTTFSDPWITKLIFIYKSISDNSGKWSDI